VVRLIGLDYPDLERAQDAWGDSALQPVIDAVKNAGLVGGSIAALTAKANVDIIKVPGLTQALSTDAGTQKMVERWSNANVAKSVVNALLIDEREEWNQLQVSFSGLPQVLQMYLTIASGAADIPATRLLGRSPEGQNSTGDSDIRNYYDRLSSDQAMRMTPILSRLDDVLLMHTFGERDPKISYTWAPLWQESKDEKATTALKKSQAHKIDVDAGLIAPDALRVGRQNQLVEDGVYPGFESALQDAEKVAEEDVPEEALAPHPAIREKVMGRELAQQRFEQGQQNQIEMAKVKPKQLPFGGGKKQPQAANGNGSDAGK
jgi:phage-related protein (TIGR01555 family)